MNFARFTSPAFSLLLGGCLVSLSACSSGGVCEGCADTPDGFTAMRDLASPSDLRTASTGADLRSADLSVLQNESCASAQPLPFVANRAELTGTTLGRRDDTSARCGGSGPDTVYSLKTVEPFILVEAKPLGSMWSPHVYLKTYCENPQVVEDICATSAFWTTRFPAGSYFLVVDSDGTGGDYSLNVELRPTAIGMGETCSAPQFLTFTGDTATVTTYTHGTASGPKIRCASTLGRDVYSFVLGSPQKLEATVTSMTPSFQPTLALRGGGPACTTGSDIECTGSIAGTAKIAPTVALDSGSYTLVVTGSGGTTGQYTLTVKVRP